MVVFFRTILAFLHQCIFVPMTFFTTTKPVNQSKSCKQITWVLFVYIVHVVFQIVEMGNLYFGFKIHRFAFSSVNIERD